MVKKIKDIYPILEKQVSKDAFTWILKDCLSKVDLENIYKQCRIETEGSRTSAQSPAPEMLAKEIAQEFYKNPKARELVAYYLNTSTQNETDYISNTSITEILKILREPQSPLMVTGKVGKYLWSIIVDERPEAIVIVPIFILKVLETIQKFTNILKGIKKDVSSSRPFAPPFRQTQWIDKDPQKLKEELNKAKKELDENKEECKKFKNRNASLEDRVEDLQEQYKVSLSEVQQLKHDKNISSKRIKEFEQYIEEMKNRYHDLEDVKHKQHHLERDNKMLLYELEKKGKEYDNLINKVKDKDQLIKMIKNLEDKVEKYESVIKKNEDEIKRYKEGIKKDALFKKEERKAVKSTIPKVGIFVDVQNIFYATKEKFESKLDFQKLMQVLLRGRKLVKAVAYVVKNQEIKQDNFINTLEEFGYEIKVKYLKIRLDGSAKGDWDLGIAIDTISIADKLDVVVLVSGDGDFVDLVKMLKERNIRVEVASFPHNTSGDLIDASDLHIELDEKVLLNS